MYWARSSSVGNKDESGPQPACHQPPRLSARPINVAAAAANIALEGQTRSPPCSQGTRVQAWTGPSEPIEPKPRDQPIAHNNAHPRASAPNSATRDTHRSTLDGRGVDDSLMSNCALDRVDHRKPNVLSVAAGWQHVAQVLEHEQRVDNHEEPGPQTDLPPAASRSRPANRL